MSHAQLKNKVKEAETQLTAATKALQEFQCIWHNGQIYTVLDDGQIDMNSGKYHAADLRHILDVAEQRGLIEASPAKNVWAIKMVFPDGTIRYYSRKHPSSPLMHVWNALISRCYDQNSFLRSAEDKFPNATITVVNYQLEEKSNG